MIVKVQKLGTEVPSEVPSSSNELVEHTWCELHATTTILGRLQSRLLVDPENWVLNLDDWLLHTSSFQHLHQVEQDLSVDTPLQATYTTQMTWSMQIPLRKYLMTDVEGQRLIGWSCSRKNSESLMVLPMSEGLRSNEVQKYILVESKMIWLMGMLKMPMKNMNSHHADWWAKLWNELQSKHKFPIWVSPWLQSWKHDWIEKLEWTDHKHLPSQLRIADDEHGEKMTISSMTQNTQVQCSSNFGPAPDDSERRADQSRSTAPCRSTDRFTGCDR